MSKMIRVDSCGECEHQDWAGTGIESFCVLLSESQIFPQEVQSIITDQSKILPNCPLEDYPETDENMPCPECKKPRANNNGILTTPCPHCGDEIPF